jgi:UDP-N-acetylmuramate dehydrogenase
MKNEPHQQDRVVQACLSEGIPHRRAVCLSEYSYMKTGGTLRLLIEPKDVNQLCAAINVCREAGCPVHLIGATSNVLFLDGHDYGVAISTVKIDRITLEHNELVAECGAMLGDLSRFALRLSSTGYEGLEGIPGTIGGAIFMNAGAYGSEIKHVLRRVELYHPEKGRHEVGVDELQMKYRYSRLKDERESIVLRGFFGCTPGNEADIYRKMELYHAKRHRYQEWCYPNLGTLFAGDVDRELALSNTFYRIVVGLHYRLAYKYKLLGRESPINRLRINRFTAQYFGLSPYEDTYSRKNMNCMVNTGQGTAKMLAYIDAIKKLTGNRIPIENEILYPATETTKASGGDTSK